MIVTGIKIWGKNDKHLYEEKIIRSNGSVQTPAVVVPTSIYISTQAAALFKKTFDHEASHLNSISEKRDFYDKLNSERLARMRAIYSVTIEPKIIAGVQTDIVTPTDGIALENQHKVLINLHGGAFLWGARSGGQVESVPIASIGKIKVITIDYREGPEHRFPAASEDVAAVYKELLQDYKADSIGIYGCSSGAILATESIAWLQKVGLPRPGAIGAFCGAASDISGDSIYVAPMLSGQAPPDKPHSMLAELPYFSGANLKDPLVFPINSEVLLTKFPPTLLITASRDFAMSSVINTHIQLSKAGAKTELYVWEGLWHAFFVDPDMPESKEVYNIIVKFFDKNLYAQ